MTSVKLFISFFFSTDKIRKELKRMKRLPEEKGFPPGEDGYFRARKVGTLGVPASKKSSVSSALRQRSQIMNSSILPHKFLSNLFRLLSYQLPIFTLPSSILVVHISYSKRKKLLKSQGGQVHQPITHARVVEADIEIVAPPAFLQFKFLLNIIFPATIGMNGCLADDFATC
jgi:hypothetical protein